MSPDKMNEFEPDEEGPEAIGFLGDGSEHPAVPTSTESVAPSNSVDTSYKYDWYAGPGFIGSGSADSFDHQEEEK